MIVGVFDMGSLLYYYAISFFILKGLYPTSAVPMSGNSSMPQLCLAILWADLDVIEENCCIIDTIPDIARRELDSDSLSSVRRYKSRDIN